MSITSTLREAQARFMSDTGIEPNSMYLGNDEHRDLQIYCRSLDLFMVSDCQDREFTRMEWCGMKIYRVDASKHIGFAGIRKL